MSLGGLGASAVKVIEVNGDSISTVIQNLDELDEIIDDADEW